MALHNSHKNEILIGIKDDLDKLETKDSAEKLIIIKKIRSSIDNDLALDSDWSQFELHFDEVHENFLSRIKVKYPELRPIYMKLCVCIRMKLTTKQIAALLKTSAASVEKNKYRLREKLQLSEEIRLTDFIQNF
jgi:DNA-binding NarL/FixJ family response regulator